MDRAAVNARPPGPNPRAVSGLPPLVLAILVLASFGLPSPTRGTDVPGQTIGADAVWAASGSPYVLLGDVTIAPGVELRVEAGVEILIAGDFEMDVQGALLVQGTAGAPVRFTLERATVGVGAWRGVRTSSDGSVDANHVAITNAREGLVLDSTGTSRVRNATFYASSLRAVRVDGDAEATFHDCSMTGNPVGLQLNAATNVTVSRCSFLQNVAAGIEAFNSAATVTWSVFDGNGITGNSAAFTLHHNNFLNDSGYFGVIGGGFLYPGQEGNHWDDYAGADDGSGGRTAGDGVGDTNLPHNQFDVHPLLGPLGGAGDPRTDVGTPTVTFDAPEPGEVVTDQVLVLPRVSDDTGVVRVEFEMDGVLLGTQTAAPYRWTWDASAAAPGAHEIRVRALDPFGKSGEAVRQVTVPSGGGNQKPLCTITRPADRSVVAGTVDARGTSRDPDGLITAVEVRIDGGSWTAAQGLEDWTYAWDTAGLANGTHTFEVRASDGELFCDIASVSVTVGGDDGSGGGTGGFPTLVVAAAILLIVVLVAAYLVWRRRARNRPSR